MEWSKTQYRNSRVFIEQKKQELELAMINPVGDQELIKKINDELSKAYQEEEEYWRQRSRLLWLKLGDRNTGYFHAVSKNRRRANNLSVLEKSNGEMVYKEEDITKVIV